MWRADASPGMPYPLHLERMAATTWQLVTHLVTTCHPEIPRQREQFQTCSAQPWRKSRNSRIDPRCEFAAASSHYSLCQDEHEKIMRKITKCASACMHMQWDCPHWLMNNLQHHESVTHIIFGCPLCSACCPIYGAQGNCPTTHLPHPTCYEAQGLSPTPSLASSHPWAY